ncbi:MAG: peptide ABC transporter substrate-binding protein [Rhodospirillaceae bacterium]|nr:MAG: peptide ABC transporter substrate-binding protein [Rhodospirillaceae bacterium]
MLEKIGRGLALGAICCAMALGSLSASAEESATPKKGGTLTVGTQSDAQTLDPIASVQWSERQILFLVFDSLVTLAPDFSIHPLLAESWDVSPDGKRITLHLRKGVKFHDGTDFDADAVKWNFDHRLDPATGSAQRKQLAVIDSVEVVDKSTVTLNLKEAFPPLMAALADRAGLMESPAAAQKYGKDIGSHPVGTGPFVFKEWVRGNHVTVDRNEQYWQEGHPYLDHVVFTDIANTTVGLQRLVTGEIDFVAELQPRDIQLVQDNPDIKLDPIKNGQWYSLQWHWNEPPFNNAKLRQAIAYAIDRNRINAILWNGQATIANGPSAPGLWWSPSDKPYEYNPEKAKQLLAEAGIKPGTKITLSDPSNNILRQYDQLVKEQLDAIGLDVQLQPVDYDQYYQLTLDRKINFVPMTWTQRADPDGLLHILFHSKGTANSTGYSNPEVDKLLDQARLISDTAKRKELYDQVHKILAEDLPYVSIVFSAEYAAMGKGVQGFTWIPDLIPRFRDMWKDQ